MNTQYKKIRQKQQDAVIQALTQKMGVWRDERGLPYWFNPVTECIEILDPQRILVDYGVDVGFRIYAQSEDSVKKETLTKAQLEKYYEQKAKNSKRIDVTRGPFVFARWAAGTVKRHETLGPAVKPETLARLVVLAGYLGWQTHYIMRGTTLDKRHSNVKATKSDIKKMLGLSAGTFDRFWDDATKNEYIVGSDDIGYVLSSIFWRGHLHGTYAQRIYIEEYRKLYFTGQIDTHNTANDDTKLKALRPVDHKKLGRIIALLPYLHIQENILCWNPWEEDATKIDPLDDASIAKILGIDSNNKTRDIRDLRRATLTVDGQEMYVMGRWDVGDGDKYMYTLNPSIVYYGDTENYDRLLKSSWMSVKK